MTPTLTPPLEEEQFYTVPEVARILRVSAQSAWELCWSGGLRSIKIGKSRRVARTALDEWVHQQELEASGAR